MARSADLILLVVDAGSGKAERQKELLEIELNAVGLRLNQKPPNVYFKRKKTGGVSISSTCRLEQISEAAVAQILHEYRIHSAEVLFREDCSVEQFIDLVEGNRKYVRCAHAIARFGGRCGAYGEPRGSVSGASMASQHAARIASWHVARSSHCLVVATIVRRQDLSRSDGSTGLQRRTRRATRQSAPQ